MIKVLMRDKYRRNTLVRLALGEDAGVQQEGPPVLL
jgi:hypothetical protein